MPSLETAFNGVTAEDFADHAETVRGYVRYELVKRNLGHIVAADSLHVADVGGGSAIDAIWLASLGHDVTLVEPAEDQLEKAAERIHHAPRETRERIELIQGTQETLLKRGDAQTYDLVLSHGVAMYLEGPQLFIDDLVKLAAPGRHVSLLEKSYYGAQATLIREGRYDEAVQLRETGSFRNHMGRMVWAFLPKNLEDDLRVAGAGIATWSGVRINRDSDYRKLTNVDVDELRTIVDEEHQLGHDPDTRGLGQMLHFIAQKDSA